MDCYRSVMRQVKLTPDVGEHMQTIIGISTDRAATMAILGWTKLYTEITCWITTIYEWHLCMILTWSDLNNTFYCLWAACLVVCHGLRLYKPEVAMHASTSWVAYATLAAAVAFNWHPWLHMSWGLSMWLFKTYGKWPKPSKQAYTHTCAMQSHSV